MKKLLLIMIGICLFNQAFARFCNPLDPFAFGSCEMLLGYGWTEEGCLPISGCDYGNYADWFFDNEEICNIACSTHSTLLKIPNGDA